MRERCGGSSCVIRGGRVCIGGGLPVGPEAAIANAMLRQSLHTTA